ncbi:phosphatases II [Auriscalpium vulgare]|uniref:Phosphatases II n=1 Tax=Auriscalpium vulgare TaxID=40419 RepID=A0ACB8SCY9_9AGAM|nr:phosphatases II [Auriscalpium vulgare]
MAGVCRLLCDRLLSTPRVRRPSLLKALFTGLVPTEAPLYSPPLNGLFAMPNAAHHNIDAVIGQQLFIGNLNAATCPEVRRDYAITHIVSVCPDYPSQGPRHLTIPIQDSEYEDLLVYLPEACRFIQAALDGGGRVLVHCVMGISRSATVIAAYLMMTRRMNPQNAIALIKRSRPRVLPNYGFIKQLHVFAACNYGPSPTNPSYRAWKRRNRQDVTTFLNCLSDTTCIVPEKLFLSSEFPDDPEQASCLVTYLGLTHCLSLSPAETIPPSLSIQRLHVELQPNNRAALLLALPNICKYIRDAVNGGGQVLVHCLTESNAAVVVCAYQMWSRKLTYKQASKALHDALPLFNLTENFAKHLEIFAACNGSPTLEHPLVQAWLSQDGASSRLASMSSPHSFGRSTVSGRRYATVTDRDKAGMRAVASAPRTGLMAQS